MKALRIDCRYRYPYPFNEVSNVSFSSNTQSVFSFPQVSQECHFTVGWSESGSKHSPHVALGWCVHEVFWLFTLFPLHLFVFESTYLLEKVGHLSCRISQILDLAECNLALICDVILCTPACFLRTCIVVFISIWVWFSLWQECVLADASVSPQEAAAVRLSHFQLR